MTEFTIPPFTLDYDGRWVEIDLHGDLDTWAQHAAREVLTRWQTSGRKREKQLTALFRAAGQIARKAQDASMALLLYPVLGESIPGMVRFCPVDLGGNDDLHAWSALVENIFPPDSWGEHPPEVTEIHTRAGTCRRISRRVVTDPVSGAEREDLVYIWVFEHYGAGVIMAPSFGSSDHADTWRPALDELAAVAELDDSAGSSSSGPRSAETLNDARSERRTMTSRNRSAWALLAVIVGLAGAAVLAWGMVGDVTNGFWDRGGWDEPIAFAAAYLMVVLLLLVPTLVLLILHHPGRLPGSAGIPAAVMTGVTGILVWVLATALALQSLPLRYQNCDDDSSGSPDAGQCAHLHAHPHAAVLFVLGLAAGLVTARLVPASLIERIKGSANA